MGISMSKKIVDNEATEVYQKLMKLGDWKEKSETKLRTFSNLLSDAGLYKEKFFDTRKYSPSDFKLNLPNMKETESIASSGSGEGRSAEILEIVDLLNRPMECWRIKLILTEIETDIISFPLVVPIANKLAKRNSIPWGIMHAALQIGPWMLEWNKSNLVVPRAVSSRAAVFCADVELTQSLDDSMLEKVSAICTEWNAHKKFNLQNCNCQTFVDTILRALESKPLFEHGVLGQFLTRIQTEPSSLTPRTGELQFEYTDPTGEEHVIKTHQKLDELCYHLTSKTSHLPTDHRLLLKAIDRAFWMRLNEANARFKGNNPRAEESNLIFNNRACSRGCFFQDPSTTGTLPTEITNFRVNM